VGDRDAVAAVTANDVAGGDRRAADGVVRRPRPDEDAVERVAEGGGAVDVRADVIALDRVAARAAPQDFHAVQAAADGVAPRGRAAAYLVAGRAGPQGNPESPVRDRRGAIRPHAKVVPGHNRVVAVQDHAAKAVPGENVPLQRVTGAVAVGADARVRDRRL